MGIKFHRFSLTLFYSFSRRFCNEEEYQRKKQSCLEKYEKIATILLEYGADPNLDEIEGSNSYMLATELYSVDLRNLLREKNANIPIHLLILHTPWLIALISLLVFITFVILLWICIKKRQACDSSKEANKNLPAQDNTVIELSFQQSK